MKENEELLKNNIDKFKSKSSRFINNTVSPLSSNNYPYSYNQPSADIIKLPLLKSPGFHYHALQFTKHLSSMTLEVNTLLQIQKLWNAFNSALYQSL